MPDTIPEKKHSRLFSFALVIIPVILTLLLISFFSKNNKLKQTSLLSPTLSPIQEGPSPTSFPFQELTIPALRNRTYTSSLGSLDQISRNDRYTSYVTSYTSDGLKINGLLTQPTGDKPTDGWPAIVFIHGYIPPTQYATTGNSYSAYVDYLARNGFVVFKIDLRGHGESEGDASGAYYSSDYSIDALNAYAALQGSDFVNPHAIGLWGHSMAGNVVLRTIAAKPDIPVAVIWAGAVYTYIDMQKYGISDTSYRPPANDSERQRKRRELFEKYGQFDPSNAFWKQVVPTNFLSDVKTALEVHHAVDDTVVNIGYSRDLMKLLDATSIPHKLYEYPTGGHNISGISFTQAMDRTVEFYKTYIEKP